MRGLLNTVISYFNFTFPARPGSLLIFRSVWQIVSLHASHYLHNHTPFAIWNHMQSATCWRTEWGSRLRSFNVFICIISKINTRSEHRSKLSSFPSQSFRLPFKTEAPNGHQMWLLQKSSQRWLLTFAAENPPDDH